MKKFKFLFLLSIFFMLGAPKMEAQFNKTVKGHKPTGTTSSNSGPTIIPHPSSGPSMPSLRPAAPMPTGHVRIFKSWSSPTKRINVERGLGYSEIHNGAWSAMWIFKPIPGTDFYRIENKWKKGQALCVSDQKDPSGDKLVTCRNIAAGDRRAQWKVSSKPTGFYIISAVDSRLLGLKNNKDLRAVKPSGGFASGFRHSWKLSMKTTPPPPPSRPAPTVASRNPLVPTGLVQIELAHLPKKRINVERQLRVSEIYDGAMSAIWDLKWIAGKGYYRIENRLKKNGQALNINNNSLQFSRISENDPDQGWIIKPCPTKGGFTLVSQSNKRAIAVSKNRFIGYDLMTVDGNRRVSSNNVCWNLSKDIAPETRTPPKPTIQRDPLIPTGFVRIETDANSSRINVEKELTVSRINNGAWSAMWTLKPIEGSIYYRIENKWKKNGQTLNVNNGTLQFSKISENDPDGQWEIKPVGTKGKFALKSRSGYRLCYYSLGGPSLRIINSRGIPKYTYSTWLLSKV